MTWIHLLQSKMEMQESSKQRKIMVRRLFNDYLKVPFLVEVLWQIPVAIMSSSILNFAAETFSKNRRISFYYLQYTKHIKAIIYPTNVEFVSKTLIRMLSANSQFEPAFVVSCNLSLRIRFSLLRMRICWSVLYCLEWS